MARFSTLKMCMCLATAFLCVCNVGAQDVVHISVEDAVRQCVSGNLSLQQSAIGVSTAERAKNTAWNSLSPSIGVNAGITKSGVPTVFDSEIQDTEDSNPASVSVGASVKFGLSPSIATSVKGAKLKYEKQLIDFDTAAKNIELQVRKAFYGLLYEQEQIALQRSNAETAKNQYDSNQTKYNRGLLPRLDVLNSQIAWQNAKLSLASAETSLSNDIATFKHLLGLDIHQDIVLDGDLGDFLDKTNVSTDANARTTGTIASLEKNIEIAKNSLLATRLTAYAPSVTAGYSYTQGAKTDDWNSWSGGGSLSVGISLPLDGFLPWSSGAQSVKNQIDNLKTLQLQLQDAKITQEIHAEQYANKIKQLESTIALRQQTISFAEESYKLTLDAYNAGTRDLLSLQSARDSLLQAQVSLKGEVYSLISAVLDLEDTLGVPFGTLMGEKEL